MKLKYKNQWGSFGSNLDPQRADLFRFVIDVPQGVGGGGANVWDQHVSFAVTNFPFPESKRETTGVKFLNQTNHILLGDTPTTPQTINIRYAFNQATAQVLYRWHYLTSNPRTGGSMQTSAVKTFGHFYWLVPNVVEQQKLETEESMSEDTMNIGLAYVLEGCLITGLKPQDGNQLATGDNAIVHLQFELTIDRYYPEDIGDMVFGTLNYAAAIG
jgi:hypothetical protein